MKLFLITIIISCLSIIYGFPQMEMDSKEAENGEITEAAVTETMAENENGEMTESTTEGNDENGIEDITESISRGAREESENGEITEPPTSETTKEESGETTESTSRNEGDETENEESSESSSRGTRQGGYKYDKPNIPFTLPPRVSTSTVTQVSSTTEISTGSSVLPTVDYKQYLPPQKNK